MHTAHQGLSKLYEVSTQRLDFLAENGYELKDHCFGSRLMGGGFGGCTINLVYEGKEAEFRAEMSKRFKEKYNEELKIYEVKLSPGVFAYDYTT